MTIPPPSSARLLETIQSPADLKKIPLDQLAQLSNEIRDVIMTTDGTNGGHLAPNLGTVEIALAMNIVFDFAKDRLLWDVGHQCYTHKLSDRAVFPVSTLRKRWDFGISGA